jgi:predicted Zn-dependent protease
MKHRISIIALSLLACLLTSVAIQAEDVVFRAMEDELNRSMDRLVIEDMQPPYFMSYLVKDYQTTLIKARYGSVVKSETDDQRYFYIEMRVGDPALDNTNFVGTWQDLGTYREGLVEEDNYNSLRHIIWLETDKAYKRAVENLARKGAYIQTHPGTADIPDFTAAEAAQQIEAPVELTRNVKDWEEKVTQAAAVFDGYPALQDWQVECHVYGVNSRYLNSETAKCQQSGVIYILRVSATALAEDGQRLSTARDFIAGAAANPLDDKNLLANIQKMAEELTAAVSSEPLDEFAGPVLFQDLAAAQLISQLFVNQLSLERKVLAVDEWMNRYLPMGKLVNRINRRVFPEFITITDEPLRESWRGESLLRFQAVDDEGVPSRNITLVKQGRLTDIPLTRRPTKKLSGSNGHAITLQNQWTVPAISNLIVKSDQALSEKKLMSEFRQLIADFDNEYGLVITQLDNPDVTSGYKWIDQESDEPPILTQPVIMYKLYAADGRMEPVRGLVFDEVSIRNLRDIYATGKDERLYNISQSSPFPGMSYPASIVTPSILVEELEFKADQAKEPLPISRNPMFEK